jgi:dUTP pyrophosphatase
MLANNLGVIDQSYTGNIIVALRKVDKLAPDLELPLKIAQIVPMPASHFEIEEVESLEVTNRGIGGFGSTGS